METLSATINFEPSSINPIVSDECLTPLGYLAEYFPKVKAPGKAYFNRNVSGLRKFMDESGDEEMMNCWDYPLSEIGHIIENEIKVVLVKDGPDTYRFFQIPER